MTVSVKICGITTPAIMDAAVDAGAHYVGLVFFARSPRNLSYPNAAALAQRAKGRARVVALVVDPTDEALDDIMRDVSPDWLQLHGHEPVERVAALKARYDRPILKALTVASALDVAAADPYRAVADLILFDAKPPADAALPGGNGRAFDWGLLTSVRYPFMLSGGLTPDTVATAIASTNASAVDVSSGVECAPGVKDAELIRRFLRASKPSRIET